LEFSAKTTLIHLGEYLTLCGNRPGSIIDPMTGVSKEIDECTLMPQMCQNGICMNVPGSFKCECNRGYIYDEDAHQCIGKNYYRLPFVKGNGNLIRLFQMITNATDYPVLAVETPSVSTLQEASNALVQMVTNSASLAEIALVFKKKEIQHNLFFIF
jgi:hypothetical protein